MKLTTLGHAGLWLEHTRRPSPSRIVIDPWFAPSGAFLGSWFVLPDNFHLLEGSPEVTRPDAIVISHEHLDHVDPWFLRQVPADTPTYVPRYASPVLRKKLASAGLEHVQELSPWEEVVAAPGIEIFFVPETSPMNHDAAIVVRCGDHTLLNLNDARICPLDLREIRRRVGGRVHALTVQGAGASWFPVCYELDEERAAKLAFQKRMAKLGYVFACVRTVEPAIVVPFAGPPCFLDDELRWANDHADPRGIFPPPWQVAEWLRARKLPAGTRVETMLPGDTLDVAAATMARDPQWADFSFEPAALTAYIEAYASRRAEQVAALREAYPEPRESLWPAFRAYFDRLLGLSEYFCKKIHMPVGFDVRGSGGGYWVVDFRAETRGVYAPSSPEERPVNYRYQFDSRWLRPILAGELPWEDFFLSLRFRAWRAPDRYNDHLLGLLKFADADALAAVEAFERSLDRDARITVRHGDTFYAIQRFCPHAGQDLTEVGEILPSGVLRCNSHHYEFDLETGECLNGETERLFTEVRPR
jgi:UDP-MurNAc hydroxylase